jgi:tetratricopeptide (TPR) repeat protein
MASALAAPSGRWVYGPARDLLFGCGLWYALALAAFAVAGADIRTGFGMAVMPFAVLAFSTPHYGATLLRVYEQREDRRAYTYFTLHISALLAVLFAVGVHSALVGSILLTLYFTWSPWHYTGQNYGIAVMFLRRRGVVLPPAVKRSLYASFILSYVLAFLALHGGGGRATDYAPVYADDATYQFLPLGIPGAWASTGFAVVAVAYAVALVTAALQLHRRASARTLAPVALIALTQALWFSVPLAMRQWRLDAGIEPWAEGYGTYYFLWIAVGHSVQYLWITSYYARAGGRWSGPARYFGKALLAGAAIWALPALVFAPGVLGRLPFDFGLGILVAATVNIHHFILDGAIWKLRQGRVARVLLRDRQPPASGVRPDSPRRSWLAPLVWVTGALCLAVMFGGKWEREVGIKRAIRANDVARMEQAVDRLERVGRASPKLHLVLGQAHAKAGREARALAEYERSLALYETAPAWFAIGALRSRQGDWPAAAEAYRAAANLDPRQEQAWYRLGLAHLRLGQPERARDAFAHAAALRPDRKINREMLERARSAIAAGEG